jgi:hypothetical protein
MKQETNVQVYEKLLDIVTGLLSKANWYKGAWNVILSSGIALCASLVVYGQDTPAGKAGESLTGEVHVDGQAIFDLPGARAVTGIDDLNAVSPTFVFADSGERRFQPGVGAGFSITGLKDRLGGYGDFVHIIGDTRTATATSPPATVTLTNARSFSIIKLGLQLNILPNKSIVPYFQFGAGTMLFTESGTQTSVNTNNPGTFPGPRKTTSQNALIHSGVGVRIAQHSFSNRRSIGLRTGIDGYYLHTPIVQRLPATSLQNGIFDVLKISRRGFGNAYLGVYYQFR